MKSIERKLLWFFEPSESSQKLGRAFLDRRRHLLIWNQQARLKRWQAKEKRVEIGEPRLIRDFKG